MTSSKPPLSSPPLPHILSLNHHHRLGHGHSINIAAASSSDQQQQPTTCSRWNPTAEQLLALEELYRRGIRSPTAAQIQQIATRLRRFGKIEGKNVFYWFQNHKARERQKRRRLADNARPFADQDQPSDTNTSGKLPENQHAPVLRREGYKVEQKKSRVRALNCSKRSEASNVSPGNSNSSIEPDAGMKIQRNATWQAVELPSSPSHSMMTTTTTVSIYRIRPQDFNEDLTNNLGDDQETVAGETLELFPLKGGVNGEAINVRKQDIERVGRLSAPNHQYIEFLPLKN